MWPRWATGTPTLPTSPRGHRDRRGRSRSGSAGRRRSTARSGPWPGSSGRARWRPRPSSGPSTSASSRAGRAHGRILALSGGARRSVHGGVGPVTACRQALEVLGRGGSSTAPERAQVRRRPLHVEQRGARSPRSRSTRATSATLDASVARWNIDSPAKRPPMRTPYRPPTSSPSSSQRLDAVGPAEVVQADVGLDERRRDPAARPAGVGAAHHHLGEARCRCGPRSGAALRRSERLTRRPSSGMTPRGSGDHQPTLRRAERHREQPAAVGGEQRARLEVGADARRCRRRRPCSGAGNRHRVGGGSIGARSSTRTVGHGPRRRGRPRPASQRSVAVEAPPGLAAELAGGDHAAQRRHGGVVGVAGTRRTARRGSPPTCRGPTRSSRASGPIGKLQPPFMAVSMSSTRRRAVLEHAHRVVEVREQQGVDDEAGPVGDLDRRPCRRPWRTPCAVLMVSSLAVSGRTTSTSFIIGAGLKKWMPQTRSGRWVAIAISTTGSVEVLVARMPSALTICSSSANSSCLVARSSTTLSITRSQSARSAQVVGGRDAGEDGVAVVGLQLALGDLAVEVGRDAGEDAVGALLGPRRTMTVEPGAGGDLGQPRPHDPRADDADRADLSHRRSVVTRGVTQSNRHRLVMESTGWTRAGRRRRAYHRPP